MSLNKFLVFNTKKLLSGKSQLKTKQSKLKTIIRRKPIKK